MTTLLDTWHYWVRLVLCQYKTGWNGKFWSVSVGAWKTVWADPSLRYSLLVAGTWSIQETSAATSCSHSPWTSEVAVQAKTKLICILQTLKNHTLFDWISESTRVINETCTLCTVKNKHAIFVMESCLATDVCVAITICVSGSFWINCSCILGDYT